MLKLTKKDYLTKVDLDFNKTPELRSLSKETVFYRFISPDNLPGYSLYCFSKAIEDSIPARLSSKLATEHFVNNFLGSSLESSPTLEIEKIAEEALKNTNDELQHFGHRLAATNLCSCIFFAFVKKENFGLFVQVGDLGLGSLIRGDSEFRFFDSQNQKKDILTGLGTNKTLEINLASVTLKNNDEVFLWLEEKEFNKDDYICYFRFRGADILLSS